jgi:hypothetical protein
MPFVKGQSGNPGGRVGVPKEVRELARTHTKAAIDKLAVWMRSDDPRASVACGRSADDYCPHRSQSRPQTAGPISACFPTGRRVETKIP